MEGQGADSSSTVVSEHSWILSPMPRCWSCLQTPQRAASILNRLSCNLDYYVWFGNTVAGCERGVGFIHSTHLFWIATKRQAQNKHWREHQPKADRVSWPCETHSWVRFCCCCCSVAKSSLTLCDSVDCSTPGSPVLQHLLEFAQTHVHWVGDANYPLLLLPSIFPSLRVFSNELVLRIRWPKYWSFGSASVLPMNIQGWFPLGLTGLISLQSKGLSRVFSNTTIRKDQFFSAQPSLWPISHIHTWLLEKTIALTM